MKYINIKHCTHVLHLIVQIIIYPISNLQGHFIKKENIIHEESGHYITYLFAHLVLNLLPKMSVTILALF
jgi:hypothetical protein